jgi:hypothetical protein
MIDRLFFSMQPIHYELGVLVEYSFSLNLTGFLPQLI